MQQLPSIAIVTRETRLKGLLARWGTKGAAEFRLRLAHEHEAARWEAPGTAAKATRSRSLAATTVSASSWQTALPKSGSKPAAPANAAASAAAEFADYELENETYESAVDKVRDELNLGYPLTFIGRDFIPNYDFSRCVAVVVLGQDGLVANVAKYVGNVPIIAVNPDPRRFDGVLLPFRVRDIASVVQSVVGGRAKTRGVTLAEMELNDGQRMLAFNDFFIGCSSHTSARYLLHAEGRTESHSSSGMIVSTGAGSTGWLSSIFHMMNGFARWQQAEPRPPLQLSWEDRRLAWVVREPFVSKQSTAALVAGLLEDGRELVIESLMPGRGVIFSDGIESDFIEFNSGSIARIRRAPQVAQLVVPAR